MENTKKCPVGLDGFQHFCPDDPKNHEPLAKIKSYLERKFEGKTEADISNEPWRREHWATLQFIRGGCKGERPKTQLAEAQTPSKAEAPTITPDQQKAMDDLAQLRAGVPFNLNRGYPQTAVIPKQPKIVTFEEEILHTWQTNPNIRAGFVSFSSYQAYMKAQRGGKAKTVKDRIAK